MHLVRLMWSSAFESPPQSFSRLSRSNFECWLRRRRRLIHMKLICTEFDSVYVKYGFWTRRKVISMFYGNRSDFFIKKYFFSGKWPVSWKASSEENGTGQYPVWMTQKPRELKSKKIPGEACPRTPLETYPFGARLENRSVFIPGSAPGISN